MPNIVILGSPSPTTNLLVNELSKAFNVALVVIEHQPVGRKLRLLQHRCKRLGLWKVFQQVLFLVWDRLYIGLVSKQRIQALLKDHDVNLWKETLDVRDVNASEVVKRIKGLRPSCGVVSGTSLLRAPLIESVPVWLNIHCGITPRYRGVHGAFWAVFEGRPELAGVTIHQVDAGVDTGGIVAQATIEVEQDDTYRTLPVKQYLKGISLMVTAVGQALEGRLRPYRRTDLESKLWYSPTIAEHRQFQRNLRARCGR